MKTSASRALGSLLIATLVACSGKEVKETPQAAADSSIAPPRATPGHFTRDDFARLRWMQGRWEGFMSNGQRFYEEYAFVDDSTINMTSFGDSSFSRAGDHARVTLRNGLVHNVGATARWVATRIDSAGIDFSPDSGAKNSFTWARESPTAWNATLRWMDKDGRPQTVVYALHRFGR